MGSHGDGVIRRLSLAAVLLPATTLAEAPAAYAPFDLGAHARPVSTASAEAQKAFDQGLNWTFSFNHGDAERAFREAARLDDGLAMAWWGIALVNGPHINNPMVDEAHARTAFEALGEAKKRRDKASEVEKALIDSLDARYAMPQPADRHPLDEAYAKAMAGVFRRFPQDADVATLYAESLMDVRPWDQWTKDGQPQPGTQEVLEALETARRLKPDHPGALHLTIHALEASPQPERAREAADRLRALVPDAGHLVHMPSHIDVRLGRWAEAAVANEKAMAADARYRDRRLDPGFWALYMAHSTHFLAYTAMMEGRRDVALARTNDVVAMFPPAVAKENAAFADAFLTVHMEALKRFGEWQAILDYKPPVEGLPVSTAYRHFARGVALAALGRVKEAERERAAFRAALPAVPQDAYWGSNSAAAVLAVAVPYLDGEIAYRRRRLDEAASRLREAVVLEDALKYDEPPPWTVPARHSLGAVLVAARKYRGAEAEYRADLLRYPENGWALRGLAQALTAQGKAAEAAQVKARLEKAWSRADVKVDSSCLCVRPSRARPGQGGGER
jgi:tetratricopeptide (TPR) repeat protein